ncbi:hypothetical protein KMP13_03235 [Epibacterium ulvae]|uniref:hypothetical protein n=1 Tax=Epibacterium ulvae TaxID=1156985 RepID=UPI001BFCC343|nr:hypothetical protein [Epibacterium ulvae]MBT8152916.1 hypothetical protein [Epibacterium ulvae]
MIDPDVSRLTKLINKTRESLPEPYIFDLTRAPHIRDRLLECPVELRRGPIFVPFKGSPVMQGGQFIFRKPRKGLIPHLDGYYSRKFKEVVRHLELPEDLRISDMRSGGITEAQSIADPKSLQHAAQHTRMSTTDIYTRDRSAAANNVIELRANSRF